MLHCRLRHRVWNMQCRRSWSQRFCYRKTSTCDFIITARSIATAYSNTTNGCATHANRPSTSSHNKFTLCHCCHTRGKARNTRAPLSNGIGRLIKHHCCAGLSKTNVARSPTVRSHHTLKKNEVTSCLYSRAAHISTHL